LIDAALPPGAPGCRPSGCDNSSVGVVRLRREFSEVGPPFLFCSEDKTRQRAEWGRAMMAPAALQPVCFVPLSRGQGLGPAFPGRLATRRSRAVGQRRCCAAQRPRAQLCFVPSCLSTVTEGISRSWRAVPSRAVQAFALRQAWSLVPDAAINRGRGTPFLLQLPCSYS